MPAVLTTASSVQCGHQGHVGVAPASTSKLQVSNSPVLLAADINGKSIPDCQTPQSGSNKKCTTVKSVTAPGATKLTINNAAVMLEASSLGATDGVPPGTIPATAGQAKLTAS